jgi:hypothetical protein
MSRAVVHENREQDGHNDDETRHEQKYLAKTAMSFVFVISLTPKLIPLLRRLSIRRCLWWRTD